MGQAANTFVDHAAATVELPDRGRLVGKVAKDITTGQVKAQRFAGIPYAKPPVGELRWKRPQPLSPSFRFDSDGRSYGDFASICPQPTNYALTNGITVPSQVTFHESEDCLYLNIWCPVEADGSRPSRKLPVLMFIHGGWLQIGNAHGTGKDPTDLIHGMNLDAIVVEPAYRINAFGFFAHEELRKEDPSNLTGNYGFWDQREALEWVYHNIEHFGGDPDNMTVSGLSAGAHSTHSQIMHEFDLSTQDPSYKPIIRRAFLQSNSAIWPSKPVDEVAGQLDELCALLNIPTHLSDNEKIARLRKVDDNTLVRVLAKMDIHTFRATRDTKPGAFVKPDWTKAMMDGRFAKWCQQHGFSFVIGECADEEWVYRYINTPTDKASLITQVHNYYTMPLVERMLPYYGVTVSPGSQGAQRQRQNNTGVSNPAVGEPTLYTTLGVKPAATSADIRAAYLALVRRHHPDKLQQQQGLTPDASAIADSLSQSDDLVRQLNQAYKTLIDDSLRSQYDESLAASRAASSSSTRPRIAATVEFESFQPIESEDASASMAFKYPCRCGSAYVISEDQIHDRVEVVGCDGCSENIRVRYGEEEREELGRDEVGEIFGAVCSDSQVYIAERMLVTDLVQGGLDAERVLRYRINYRAKILDQVLPGYKGVSHSFDDFVWWYASLEEGEERDRVGKWLLPYKAFIHGEDVHKQWYEGSKADVRTIRVLEKNGSISVGDDQRWRQKEDLIKGMVKIREELVEQFL